MGCQICKSKAVTSKFLIEDYEYDIKSKAEYKVCKDCTVIYRERFNKLKIENLYGKNYIPISGGLFYDFLKKLNSSYELTIIQRLRKKNFNSRIEKLRILDIACGKGFLIEKFSRYVNSDCYGIDINQENKIKRANLRYYQKPFNAFNFIKKINPNLIILNNFLEHIENLNEFKQFLNILNKNACLIIITPDSSGKINNIFEKHWSGYHSPRHVNIFNKKSMKLFLRKNNLDFYIENILDPLSILSSLKNCYTDLVYKFKFKKLGKLIFCLLRSVIYVLHKDRMIIICKKK